MLDAPICCYSDFNFPGLESTERLDLTEADMHGLSDGMIVTTTVIGSFCVSASTINGYRFLGSGTSTAEMNVEKRTNLQRVENSEDRV